MKRVEVYTTPTCPWCTKTKSFLKEKNIRFQEFDISSDEEARSEMARKSGQMGVPVIEIDGRIIVGFDHELITKALEA